MADIRMDDGSASAARADLASAGLLAAGLPARPGAGSGPVDADVGSWLARLDAQCSADQAVVAGLGRALDTAETTFTQVDAHLGAAATSQGHG